MFHRDFERIMREMERDLQRALMRSQHGPRFAERDFDGRRVEIVNGNVEEQFLVDGEWVDRREFLEGQHEDDDVAVEITDGDDEPLRTTIDLSTKIGSNPKSVASATFNNGILDVEFTSEVGSTDEDDE